MEAQTTRRASHTILTGFAAVCLVVLAVSTSGQDLGGNPEAQKLQNPVTSTPDSIAAGAELYRRRCSFCHGAEGKGDGRMAPKDTEPSNLTDEVWDRGATDGEIFAVIEKGAGPDFKMKGFEGKLTEEEIWTIINYVRSLYSVAEEAPSNCSG